MPLVGFVPRIEQKSQGNSLSQFILFLDRLQSHVPL